MPVEMVPCFADGNKELMNEPNMQVQLSKPDCCPSANSPQAQDPGLELGHGFTSMVAICSQLPSLMA